MLILAGILKAPIIESTNWEGSIVSCIIRGARGDCHWIGKTCNSESFSFCHCVNDIKMKQKHNDKKSSFLSCAKEIRLNIIKGSNGLPLVLC